MRYTLDRSFLSVIGQAAMLGGMIAEMDCTCSQCKRSAGHPDASLHRRIRSLVAQLDPGEQITVVAGLRQRDPARWSDAGLLSEVAGVERHLIESMPIGADGGAAVMSAVARVVELGADEHSRRILNEDLDMFLHAVRTGNPPDAPRPSVEICLRLKHGDVKFVYPRVTLAIFIMSEVFVTKDYDTDGQVDRIYDFGANVGASALQFYSKQRDVQITCIEPSQGNLNYLRQNLQLNDVRSDVLPVAVGSRRGAIELYEFPNGGVLNSFMCQEYRGVKAKRTLVECVPFDEIVSGTGYGLKIDVEGAEQLLAEYESIFANAAWVVGEIHYLPDATRKESRAFENQIAKHFELHLDTPRFVGDADMVIRAFRTVAKRS